MKVFLRLGAYGLLLSTLTCARQPRMLDYISLPPPTEVRAEIIDRAVEISWQFSGAGRPLIAAYNVYWSTKSLIYRPLAKLPLPAAVALPSRNHVTLPIPKDAASRFVHVRCVTRRGDMSLPSLPEVRIDFPARRD